MMAKVFHLNPPEGKAGVRRELSVAGPLTAADLNLKDDALRDRRERKASNLSWRIRYGWILTRKKRRAFTTPPNTPTRG